MASFTISHQTRPAASAALPGRIDADPDLPAMARVSPRPPGSATPRRQFRPTPEGLLHLWLDKNRPPVCRLDTIPEAPPEPHDAAAGPQAAPAWRPEDLASFRTKILNRILNRADPAQHTLIMKTLYSLPQANEAQITALIGLAACDPSCDDQWQDAAAALRRTVSALPAYARSAVERTIDEWRAAKTA